MDILKMDQKCYKDASLSPANRIVVYIDIRQNTNPHAFATKVKS